MSGPTAAAPSAAVVVSISAAYLVACLVLGILPGRKQSDSAAGYVAGDRALGLLVMYFITGATIFSAFAFLGGPGWAYKRGVAAFYILGYGALGFLPFYFLGPRAARLGRRYGFITQAEMIAARYRRPSIAGVMALVSAAAFIPYLALQMKGAGYVLASVTRGAVPVWAGAAAVYGVVLLYVVRSGVMGVGWTNTFQGVLMMGLAWGLGLYLPHRLYGGVRAMFDRIAVQRPALLVAPGLTKQGTPWTWGGYSSAVLVSTIGFSAWPHLFMKAFSARDDRTIRRTVLLYPTFQIFLVPLFLIGFAGVLFGARPPRADQILTFMLMHMELPSVVVGLFCAGALAASMSSGDAIGHAAASILVRDGVITALGKPLAPVAERRAIRWVVLAVMLAAYAVAIAYRGSLVKLLLTTYGAVVQFAPPLVATLYVRRVSGSGVLVALIVGSLITGALVLWPSLSPWAVHPGLYGLAVNVAVLVASGARAPADRADQFLEVAAGARRAAG